MSHNFYRNYIKRLLDLLLSLSLIVLFFPIFIFVSLWINHENRGSGLFFMQERPGLNGKIFKMIKFKTMTDDRDSNGELLPDAQRITPIGKIIRSASIDELPQLFNVLRGDMSFVGPRPLLIQYLPLYTKEQFRRHEVKPGITGWAQCHGRNLISWHKKFELDIWYVDHCSFLIDMSIIFLTIKKVLIHDGISQDGEATIRPFEGEK